MIPAATNGTGDSVAIAAPGEPRDLRLPMPVTMSALSLRSPTVAQRRSSPCDPLAHAAQAPDPRTRSRMPIVRISRVSVPESGRKNRPGATIIATPTAHLAAATRANVLVGAREVSSATR